MLRRGVPDTSTKSGGSDQPRCRAQLQSCNRKRSITRGRHLPYELPWRTSYSWKWTGRLTATLPAPPPAAMNERLPCRDLHVASTPPCQAEINSTSPISLHYTRTQTHTDHQGAKRIYTLTTQTRTPPPHKKTQKT